MSIAQETNPQQQLSFNVELRPRIVDYGKGDIFSYPDEPPASDLETEAERLANISRAKQDSVIAQMDIDEALAASQDVPRTKAPWPPPR